MENAEENIRKAQGEVGRAEEHGFGQEGVLLQPYVGKNNDDNTPDRGLRPTALNEDKPAVTNEQKPRQGQEKKQVVREQSKKHKAGHQKHRRAPHARWT